MIPIKARNQINTVNLVLGCHQTWAISVIFHIMSNLFPQTYHYIHWYTLLEKDNEDCSQK